ncbi:hypothetical protein AL036_04970 [Salipiger aestuarii]|uniref:Uncharacterized protein DUF2087 n=1 Tax=Salipiger aestuarii TaxID=568098 RepID=A0A327YGU6_9RHOB|nr:DUF2087 domain-containing protein [Salipiger aestuarii]EIE52274.1 hypothetical protein C357_04602 [Citreicella sp. 357]KAA8609071.1 hypothetical protein AL036_04970 [Salipiger aestuarii]KAA8614272.1 hypothetical protein AL037_03560 [Salipiger aestuarii]KAB2542762.1 hypothetical protein AL035_05240 [Salipiger aestuarii]RAK20298.1 uncharacterized protein DUF2087 [Salipiger aestuarii]
MSRDVIPLTIHDLSLFARRLHDGLKTPPSHLELLGQIARAAGYRNYQHLRAQTTPTPEIDRKLLLRALREFDADGRLRRFPSRNRMQLLCLWPIWARLPAREPLTERQISARLDALCAFRDAAQVRRTLVEGAFVTRTTDGSAYLRREQAPPAEARALIAELSARM